MQSIGMRVLALKCAVWREVVGVKLCLCEPKPHDDC